MGAFKILAIKFKYLGDVAIMVPALRTLRHNFPNAEIHVLVAKEAAPIINQIPWIDKVWELPRARGESQLRETLPFIYKLRRERFDISVDFVGNDRGAFISLAIGAKKRLGPISPKGFWGRKYCYNGRILEAHEDQHETLRDLHVLSSLKLDIPENLEPELYADPELCEYVQSELPEDAILCHLSTSMPKKEWPIARWVEFFKENPGLQERIIFSTGPSEREQMLLNQICDILKGEEHLKIINKIPDLRHFMALIKEASVVVSGDSLPAHLAAGLGTQLVVLFGPSLLHQWHPKGLHTKVLKAPDCSCIGHPHVCHQEPSCMFKIEPQEVVQAIKG